MTADDLRAIGTWVDWRGNPPKVTIPAATRDALADLIDAARPFADGCSCGDCHRLTAAFTALDQEAPT